MEKNNTGVIIAFRDAFKTVIASSTCLIIDCLKALNYTEWKFQPTTCLITDVQIFYIDAFVTLQIHTDHCDIVYVAVILLSFVLHKPLYCILDNAMYNRTAFHHCFIWCYQ